MTTTVSPPVPLLLNGGSHRFECPCRYVLECVSSEAGSMDDTASCTRYECTRPGETHCWSFFSYTSWPQASSWVFRGVKTEQLP